MQRMLELRVFIMKCWQANYLIHMLFSLNRPMTKDQMSAEVVFCCFNSKTKEARPLNLNRNNKKTTLTDMWCLVFSHRPIQ